MLKALHGWYQWKAEIESNLEVPSIQSTFWVMWRKFNIKLSHSVFTWPLFVRKCLFFQTNQPFTQTCDICTHIVSYMVGKLLKRSTFLRTQLHSYDANLKSYEFIPHAGISYMWDLTPHLMEDLHNWVAFFKPFPNYINLINSDQWLTLQSRDGCPAGGWEGGIISRGLSRALRPGHHPPCPASPQIRACILPPWWSASNMRRPVWRQ